MELKKIQALFSSKYNLILPGTEAIPMFPYPEKAKMLTLKPSTGVNDSVEIIEVVKENRWFSINFVSIKAEQSVVLEEINSLIDTMKKHSSRKAPQVYIFIKDIQDTFIIEADETVLAMTYSIVVF